MNDRKAELSDDAFREIRTALTECRDAVLIAKLRALNRLEQVRDGADESERPLPNPPHPQHSGQGG